MKRFSFPLFWKFTLAIIAIVTLFGSINGVLIWQSVYNSLEAELDKRGRFIAESIASECTTPLMFNDVVALQKILDDIQKIDTTISYAFILNGKGNVLAHTFENGVPSDLIDANKIGDGDSINTILIHPLNYKYKLIKDIAVPVLDKTLGVVRVGLQEEGISLNVNRTIKTLILMVVVFLSVGIIGAFAFAYIITNPIKIISSAAESFRLDSLKTKTKIRIKIREKILNRWKMYFRAEDELDLLAEKFNGMIERLENTYEELQTTQTSLLQSEKLASIGTLVAGIAHEINNPINGLENCIRRISKDPENTRQNEKYLKLMGEAVARIEKVMRRLLNFSRKQEISFELVDISTVIENALILVGYRLEKSRISIERNLAENLIIYGSPNHLEQVILNLLLNSIDAINERLKIEPNAKRKITFRIKENEKDLVLCIEDSGTGIAEGNIDKIFDPFFTTKSTGKGTGLGLSICYSIIKEHKGDIKVFSNYGTGTRFELVFPKIKE